MQEFIGKALWIYALAAAVALLIAALIKGLVLVLNQVERRRAASATAAATRSALSTMPAVSTRASQVAIQVDGVPPAHVAAIAAAVHAMAGGHRIVHIEPGNSGAGWAAQGRAAHHASHVVPARGLRR